MDFRLRKAGAWTYTNTFGRLTPYREQTIEVTTERLRKIIRTLQSPAQRSQMVLDLESNVEARFLMEEVVREIDIAKKSGHPLENADGIFTEETVEGLYHWGQGVQSSSAKLERAFSPFINDFKFILENYQKLENIFMELSPDELNIFANIVLALSINTPTALRDKTGKALKAKVMDIYYARRRDKEFYQFLLDLANRRNV